MFSLPLVSQFSLDPNLAHGYRLHPGGLRSCLLHPGGLRSCLLHPGGLHSRLLRRGGLLSGSGGRLLCRGNLLLCLLCRGGSLLRRGHLLRLLCCGGSLLRRGGLLSGSGGLLLRRGRHLRHPGGRLSHLLRYGGLLSGSGGLLLRGRRLLHFGGHLSRLLRRGGLLLGSGGRLLHRGHLLLRLLCRGGGMFVWLWWSFCSAVVVLSSTQSCQICLVPCSALELCSAGFASVPSFSMVLVYTFLPLFRLRSTTPPGLNAVGSIWKPRHGEGSVTNLVRGLPANCQLEGRSPFSLTLTPHCLLHITLDYIAHNPWPRFITDCNHMSLITH